MTVKTDRSPTIPLPLNPKWPNPILIAKHRLNATCCRAWPTATASHHRCHRHRQNRDTCRPWQKTSRHPGCQSFSWIKGTLTGHFQPSVDRWPGVLKNAASRPPPSPVLPHHAVGLFAEQRGTLCAPPSPDMGPLLLGRMLNSTRRSSACWTGVQDCRRQRPAAAGPERPAPCCSLGMTNAKEFTTRYGNISPRPAAPSSAACCKLKSNGDRSLASPCSTSRTSCADGGWPGASSTSWRPTSS